MERRNGVTGLWAAAPTTWDDRGQFDGEAFERNLDRYAEARVDGVYTTDSDGEFYAIELELFERIVKRFARRMEQHRLPAAVGVTWSSTAGIIERMRIAVSHGIEIVHVTFPYWMPIAPQDVDRFFDDLATAAPEGRWIHYNTERSRLVLTGGDYARIADAYPDQLIGSKQGTRDLVTLFDIIDQTPHLSHLAGEYTLTLAYRIGAVGLCSFWINVLPGWMRRWVDACANGQWDEAWAMQRKLWRWERQETSKLVAAGHLHGIIGKSRGRMTNFLEDSGFSQPPYYPVAPELQEEIEAAFRKFWEAEIEEEILI
jgi:dihydrodipicolinate synthase/N-acetylneuraminate lyase